MMQGATVAVLALVTCKAPFAHQKGVRSCSVAIRTNGLKLRLGAGGKGRSSRLVKASLRAKHSKTVDV
jgi:hypothetical protein